MWHGLANILRLKAWKAWIEPDFQFSLLLTLFFVLSSGADVQKDSFRLLTLIVSLACYLAWGVLVNDLCDLPYDEASGKKRAISHVPRWQTIGLLIVIALVGYASVAFMASADLGIVYSVAYVFAVFYSAEPVRLKRRGFHGVWSDALIERFLPALLVTLYFGRFALDAALVLAFSFVSQLEIILSHQIVDYRADMDTGVKTYVVKLGPARARGILDTYVRPLCAILIAGLAFCLAMSLPIFAVLLATLFPGYLLAKRAVQSKLIMPEDPQRPFYASYLSICVQTVFPLFLAFLAILTVPALEFLMALTLASQYRSIRDYLARPLMKLRGTT